MKLLFLTKNNLSSGGPGTSKSGLLNSATLTAEALKKHLGIHVHVETCVDSNEIDKYVHRYKPNYCILQAIWFTKEKLEELTHLHPHVKFVVRVHSKTPFLATEGIAIQRIMEFRNLHHVYLSFNNKDTNDDFNKIGIPCYYLPNIYDNITNNGCSLFIFSGNKHEKKNSIDIGCFGAIRPLKNHLHQAIASIIYADKEDKHLRFHVNGSRIEQNGDSVLKNLRHLFNHSHHQLIEHEWMEREEFLKVIKRMDIGLQISLTESFNVVTGDFVIQRVPIIVSNAIDWMPDQLKVDPLDTNELVNRIGKVLTRQDYLTLRASKSLQLYNLKGINAWKNFL